MQPNSSIGPEQVQHLGRALVGQVHLHLAAGHRHRHAARAVQRHHDGQRQLAVLVAQLHRHRQDRLQRRLVIAARSVGVAAARHQQPRPGLAHPGGRNLVQFADVPSNYWAHNAIATANQTGFLSGYPGQIFNPTQNIPRAQVLVALASGLNYSPTKSATTTLTANFADASSIPTYAQSGIAAATEKRLVVDYPDVKSLRPNQLASRAEVSAFLCLALTPSGQTSTIPGQYIANATGSSITALLNSGTSIPVKYLDAKKIVVSPKETAPLTLTVATDIKNNQGTLTIPAGSQVVGQLQPVDGGSEFVASQLIINGSAVSN